jgi:hypothetical protein
MKPRIHLTQLDFDSLTNGRALCDAQGSIGPAEFCAVMMRELRSYMQSRLTEHGFSKHRTPEDTEFTSLAATKMILAEQFSLAQRIQTLLERIDPATGSSFSAAASYNTLNFNTPCAKSAGGVSTWAAPPSPPVQVTGLEAKQREGMGAEEDATLQAVLRGQEEILRLVRQAESREAKTVLALRRMQDAINALHCAQTSTPPFDNAPSDISAEDCPVSYSNCASSIQSSVPAARPRNASPITMPTLPNPHDRIVHAPLEPAPASQSDQRGLQPGELPTIHAANHFPDRSVVRRCVSMFSARRTTDNVDDAGLKGSDKSTLGEDQAAGQVPPALLNSCAVGTNGCDPSPRHPTENRNGERTKEADPHLSFSGSILADRSGSDKDPLVTRAYTTFTNASPGILEQMGERN